MSKLLIDPFLSAYFLPFRLNSFTISKRRAQMLKSKPLLVRPLLWLLRAPIRFFFLLSFFFFFLFLTFFFLVLTLPLEQQFSTVCYLLGNNVDHLVQNNEGKVHNQSSPFLPFFLTPLLSQTAADFGEDDTMTGCLITKVDEARRLGAHPCHRYFQNQCSRSIHLAKSLKEVEEGKAIESVIKEVLISNTISRWSRKSRAFYDWGDCSCSRRRV